YQSPQGNVQGRRWGCPFPSRRLDRHHERSIIWCLEDSISKRCLLYWKFHTKSLERAYLIIRILQVFEYFISVLIEDGGRHYREWSLLVIGDWAADGFKQPHGWVFC